MLFQGAYRRDFDLNESLQVVRKSKLNCDQVSLPVVCIAIYCETQYKRGTFNYYKFYILHICEKSKDFPINNFFLELG